QAWARKARESADPGYYLQAEACAEVALDLDPASALALDLMALVRLNDHRFADAAVLARRVLAREPAHPPALGTPSDARLELGASGAGGEGAQRMVDLKRNLASYVRAAHLRWLHGDAATAKKMLRLAIDAGAGGHDPEPRAWAIVQAAMLFWHEGDYAGADA